ncbi:hypothetical protein [uncultured Nocardioides sp.]|uniref:hypothetical protein n=1 Tax=uncultured Nocardioides sp. TaxID=198441 RepID=UPI00261EC5D2|nr:hypothetical protein [uncultured Nocardioides sp.]
MSELDQVLRRCDYETLELLAAFSRTPTFSEASSTVTVTERTAKTKLLELSRVFETGRHTPLLKPLNGRRWELTPAGQELARQAAELNAALRSAVESVEGGHKVRVVTTSNCCRALVGLMSDLEDETDFTISPWLLRTMDVDFSHPDFSDVEFGFFSQLMPADKATPTDKVIELPDQSQMIVIKREPIQLLAPANVPLPKRPVSVREILQNDLTMCVPSGGVAWDYMQKGWPGWERIRYRQHFHITDLDAGLEVLRTGLAGRRAAMIVHGLGRIDETKSRLARLDDNYVLKDVGLVDNDRQFVAVTGIFRADRADRRPQRVAIAERIWEAAKCRWLSGDGLATADQVPAERDQDEVIRVVGGKS